MNYEYYNEIRAEEHACAEDFMTEGFEALGLEKILEIIREIPTKDLNEVATVCYRDIADAEELLKFLATDEAKTEDRISVITEGYGITTSEAFERFVVDKSKLNEDLERFMREMDAEPLPEVEDEESPF